MESESLHKIYLNLSLESFRRPERQADKGHLSMTKVSFVNVNKHKIKDFSYSNIKPVIQPQSSLEPLNRTCSEPFQSTAYSFKPFISKPSRMFQTTSSAFAPLASKKTFKIFCKPPPPPTPKLEVLEHAEKPASFNIDSLTGMSKKESIIFNQVKSLSSIQTKPKVPSKQAEAFIVKDPLKIGKIKKLSTIRRIMKDKNNEIKEFEDKNFSLDSEPYEKPEKPEKNKKTQLEKLFKGKKWKWKGSDGSVIY
jgi:hypothetical protein